MFACCRSMRESIACCALCSVPQTSSGVILTIVNTVGDRVSKEQRQQLTGPAHMHIRTHTEDHRPNRHRHRHTRTRTRRMMKHNTSCWLALLTCSVQSLCTCRCTRTHAPADQLKSKVASFSLPPPLIAIAMTTIIKVRPATPCTLNDNLFGAACGHTFVCVCVFMHVLCVCSPCAASPV